MYFCISLYFPKNFSLLSLLFTFLPVCNPFSFRFLIPDFIRWLSCSLSILARSAIIVTISLVNMKFWGWRFLQWKRMGVYRSRSTTCMAESWQKSNSKVGNQAGNDCGISITFNMWCIYRSTGRWEISTS